MYLYSDQSIVHMMRVNIEFTIKAKLAKTCEETSIGENEQGTLMEETLINE